ncbi:MAG TPA: hypothetical protein VGG08_04125 [Solirubrobacteraceae bacterium]|jgi:hypothetical protein
MKDFALAVLAALVIFVPLRLAGRSLERAGRKLERQRGIDVEQLRHDRDGRSPERPDIGL